MRTSRIFAGCAVLLTGCGLIGQAAAPVAMSAAEAVTKAFIDYATDRLGGAKVSQANCEVEDHPQLGELLVLCTAKYHIVDVNK